ncbi:MAG: hypothetical protein IKE27_01765 [Oscillospiraceae bacterium]|nr:hypothetical protein [Oscillospiraceae bacterium]
MDCLLALLCILFIALFYNSAVGMKAASAPFAACATVIILLTLFGALGILSTGVIAIYTLSAVMLVISLVPVFGKKKKMSELLTGFFAPGVAFFIAASVGIYIACLILVPAFRQWDEFSFWGTAAKVIWSTRQLYTTAGTSMLTSAYLPGLPLFGAFFQYFFNPFFTEYKVYVAYDVLMFSALAVLFADTKWKEFLRWIFLSLFCWFFVDLFYACTGWMNPYFSAYSDTAIGIVFGGVLLTWFMYKKKDHAVWLSTCLGLGLLTCMKDIGLALGFIIAGTISMDMVIGNDYPKKYGKGAKSLIKFIYCIVMFVIPAVIYVAWLTYFTSVTGIVSSEIPYPYSLVDIVFLGKDPRFFNFLNLELGALNNQLVNFGSIKLMCLVFTAYPIVAAFFVKDMKRIIRVAITSFILLAGFVVYNIFFAYLYTAVFHTEELVNYARYMSSYVLGWGMLISGMAMAEYEEERMKPLRKILNYAFLVLITICAVFFGGPKEKAFGISPTRLSYQSWYRKYCSDMTSEDRIFLVCQNSDGGEWMIFNYDFLPAYTLQLYGLGNIIAPGSEHTSRYDTEATREDIEKYIIDQEADYVFVLKSDEYFLNECGPLFDDFLAYYYDGSSNFYKVNYNEDGSVYMTAIHTPEQIQALHEKQ